ncbi:MAG: polysaccharide deacetylase family protein, partial [Armatimonadota bacterium]
MRPSKGCYSGVASRFVRTIFFAVVVALFVCSVMILTGQRDAGNEGEFQPSKHTSSRTFPAGDSHAHRVDELPFTPPAGNGAPVGQDTSPSDKGGESVNPSNPDQTKPDDLPKADLGTELSHGDRRSSKIALTFDAGADARPVKSILETLSRYNIHCTFFLTGEWIERNPKLTQQIALAGHEIGNHT